MGLFEKIIIKKSFKFLSTYMSFVDCNTSHASGDDPSASVKNNKVSFSDKKISFVGKKK